jgi:hypothetical protein
MHLVGFIIRIYHDAARYSECQVQFIKMQASQHKCIIKPVQRQKYKTKDSKNTQKHKTK